ncbi:hypothetical protein K7432_007560 [Basidiobolus ranarum]|uniref:DUF7905 domain-containing protein n=1 Tax=Basidiobolus ranarum TaxID=34480 RepID=A0ABR2WT93_9FUNG
MYQSVGRLPSPVEDTQPDGYWKLPIFQDYRELFGINSELLLKIERETHVSLIYNESDKYLEIRGELNDVTSAISLLDQRANYLKEVNQRGEPRSKKKPLRCRNINEAMRVRMDEVKKLQTRLARLSRAPMVYTPCSYFMEIPRSMIYLLRRKEKLLNDIRISTNSHIWCDHIKKHLNIQSYNFGEFYSARDAIKRFVTELTEDLIDETKHFHLLEPLFENDLITFREQPDIRASTPFMLVEPSQGQGMVEETNPMPRSTTLDIATKLKRFLLSGLEKLQFYRSKIHFGRFAVTDKKYKDMWGLPEVVQETVLTSDLDYTFLSRIHEGPEQNPITRYLEYFKTESTECVNNPQTRYRIHFTDGNSLEFKLSGSIISSAVLTCEPHVLTVVNKIFPECFFDLQIELSASKIRENSEEVSLFLNNIQSNQDGITFLNTGDLIVEKMTKIRSWHFIGLPRDWIVELQEQFEYDYKHRGMIGFTMKETDGELFQTVKIKIYREYWKDSLVKNESLRSSNLPYWDLEEVIDRNDFIILQKYINKLLNGFATKCLNTNLSRTYST